MLRPWHLLLVVAALFVPLQAGALGGSSGLSVSASLDYCGVNPGGVTCKIDASWSGVADAERYTGTITLADGSVTDMGTVGSGSGGGATSLWFPYAGNGVYTVTITAWGTDSDGKPKKVDEEKAGAKVDPDEQDQAPKPDKTDKEASGDDGPKPPAAPGPDESSPPVAEPEPPAAEPDPAPEPEPAPESPEPDPAAADEPPAPGPPAPAGAAGDAEASATEAG